LPDRLPGLGYRLAFPIILQPGNIFQTAKQKEGRDCRNFRIRRPAAWEQPRVLQLTL
jgi:hypothetical protein